MATFVSLINWTEKGVKDYKESVSRAHGFEALLGKAGGSVKGIWWTVGSYDLVVVADAPDAETMTAALLQVASAGNIRTSTMLAFDAAAFGAIVDRTG